MLKLSLNKECQILALTDIHEHPKQFKKMLEMWEPSPNKIIVITGDMIDKGFGYEAFTEICTLAQDLSSKGWLYFTKGNHELKALRKAKKKGELDSCMAWVNRQPISLSLYYPNGQRYTFVHAGITPKMEEKDLDSNLDVCYCRGVDSDGKHVESRLQENGKYKFVREATSWHEVYDGRFGYVVSGHQPILTGKPKFYEHSCNIDTACFRTGILTGLIISVDSRTHVQVGEHKDAFNYDPDFKFEEEFP